MLYRYFFRILFNDIPEKVNLGRWGYHWQINKNVQKYYD